jgi:hypothetical protein
MLTPTRQMRVWACAEPVNMGNYAELAVMQSSSRVAATATVHYGLGSA